MDNEVNLNNEKIEDVDIGYWNIMYLEKLNNLTELSLNLENNYSDNVGLSRIIVWMDN